MGKPLVLLVKSEGLAVGCLVEVEVEVVIILDKYMVDTPMMAEVEATGD